MRTHRSASRNWFFVALAALPAAAITAWADPSSNPAAVEEVRRAQKTLDEGKIDLALAHSGLAIELDPGWACAYTARGRVLNRKGDLPSAISDFTKAISLNPRCDNCLATALDGRAEAYERQGDGYLAGRDRQMARGVRARNSVSGLSPANRFATVLLINNLSYAQPMIVNGQRFDLNPGAKLPVSVRADSFTYEVPGITELRRREVAPGGTFPVQAHLKTTWITP